MISLNLSRLKHLMFLTVQSNQLTSIAFTNLYHLWYLKRYTQLGCWRDPRVLKPVIWGREPLQFGLCKRQLARLISIFEEKFLSGQLTPKFQSLTTRQPLKHVIN